MLSASAYPDGSLSERLQVTIDDCRNQDIVSDSQIRRIVCHRINKSRGQEEYLAEWRLPRRSVVEDVYAWLTVNELRKSLRKIQRYLDVLYKERQLYAKRQRHIYSLPIVGMKRKSPDDHYSNSSLIPSAASRSTIDDSFSNALDDFAPSYNATLRRNDGQITIEPWSDDQRSRVQLPTPAMLSQAMNPHNTTSKAEFAIRTEFQQKLLALPGPRITLADSHDAPPLTFEFIDKSILRPGVIPLDPDTVVGCGSFREGSGQSCKPHMGQEIGCEYSRVCECLEFAPLAHGRLNDEQRKLLDAGERMGLPKRFPYTNPHATATPRLVDFYLQKRDTIYECNQRCRCGPRCKTRLVQNGRQIRLEIFRTKRRGWGLRCPQNICKGQFIDTYRGEIITSKEADKREEKGEGKAKASYLYNLDKHLFDDETSEPTGSDCYVVDGEFYGGPSRFMNHSCDPNCGQYVVSWNKYDQKIYELAFFATEDIPARTELTFDYLNREDDEDAQSQDDDANDRIPCHCESENCRRWLWA